MRDVELIEFAVASLNNCHRIATTKTGTDRAGWMADARMWKGVLNALRERIYTKADCEAMCEIAVAAVREPLMNDRKRLMQMIDDLLYSAVPKTYSDKPVVRDASALVRELMEK